MKEPWPVGTWIRMRAVLGISGDIWMVEMVGNDHYTLLHEKSHQGSERRKILTFANQHNWEEMKNENT